MAQKNRISETEWKQLLPQMASFAHITTDIGYSVLVKGEKSSDVATRVGRSKQNISSTVKRIWDLYQNTTLKAENGEPLKLVQVWIPASLAETVLKEAQELGISTLHHILHLIIHGFLHLLGYDHEVDREAEKMESLEIKILQALNIQNPYEDQ